MEIMWWYNNTSITDCRLICQVGISWCTAVAVQMQRRGGGLRLTVHGYRWYGLAIQCYRWHNILRLAVQQWLWHGFHWGRMDGGLWARCVSEGRRYRGMLNGGTNWCRQDLKQTSYNEYEGDNCLWYDVMQCSGSLSVFDRNFLIPSFGEKRQSPYLLFTLKMKGTGSSAMSHVIKYHKTANIILTFCK